MMMISDQSKHMLGLGHESQRKAVVGDGAWTKEYDGQLRCAAKATGDPIRQGKREEEIKKR